MTATRDPLRAAAADTERRRLARERLLNSIGSPSIVALVRAIDRAEREARRDGRFELRVHQLLVPLDRALWTLYEARDAYLRDLAGEEL